MKSHGWPEHCYPCAVCARVMRLCPSVCVCVDKKHACLRLTARKSPQKLSLHLLHWIYSHKKTLSVLASLVRAANSWLSKATCPCKSTLRYCGCVTQPPIHVDVLTQSHMYSTEPREMRAQNLMIATVMCQSIVSACMLSSIILELSMG